jgi:hypothetical protein
MLPADIPLESLHIVLRSWSGRGILTALATLPNAPDVTADWSANDVFRRASRTMLEILCTQPENCPLLTRLPKKSKDWLDVLPAAIHAESWTARAVLPGVSWTQTMTRYGWPPTQFVGKSRKRTHDTRILEPVIWTLSRLVRCAEEARKAFREAQLPCQDVIDSLQGFLDSLGVDTHSWSHSIPDNESLRLMGGEGRPWSDLEAIARRLISLEMDPRACAYELLIPDQELAWRLFHLSSMGLVLLGLQDAGYRVVSQRPIGDWVTAPAYTAAIGETVVEVWFEAGAFWRHKGLSSPYLEATTSMPGRRALGADILLWSNAGKALVIECKYYKVDGQSAARDGYLQAAAYGSEISTVAAGDVIACAVIPASQLSAGAWTTLASGPVGVIPNSEVRALAFDFGQSITALV